MTQAFGLKGAAALRGRPPGPPELRLQTPGEGRELERLSGRERAARRGAPASATLPPAAAVAREGRRRASLESRLGVPREAGAGSVGRQRGGEGGAGGPAPRRHRRHGSSEAEDSGPSCGPRAFPARGSHVASHVLLLLEPEPRGWCGPGEVARACASRLRGLAPGTRRVCVGGPGPELVLGWGRSRAAREGAQVWSLCLVLLPGGPLSSLALMWRRGGLPAFPGQQDQVPALGGVEVEMGSRGPQRWPRVVWGGDGGTGRFAGV